MSFEAIPEQAQIQEPVPKSDALAKYFAAERNSSVRHEYLDGEFRAMAGESPEHNRIAGNVYIALESRFEDRRCEAFIEGIRTKVTETRYRYPDIVALCGDALFDNEKPPSLLNPSVIFEVLSDFTEEFDKRAKFEEYRRIDSLTDYITASQERVEVTHYARQSARQWLVTTYLDKADILEFSSLGVSLSVAEIYRKLTFKGADNSEPAAP